VRVALHDELADLRAQVGPQVFDDPVAFRAAFDDFIAEGSASTGEVSLLVGAIATGALRRLKDQLALGADPATSIQVQGDLMARDRGTSESDGCRWALSVLAHAAGAIPVDLVLTQPRIPDSLDRPGSSATQRGVVDPGPTHGITVERGAPPPPPPPTSPLTRPSPATADEGQGGGRLTNPLLLGAVAVLAVIAVIAIVLLFVRDDSSNDEDADADASSETTDGASGGDEEVLAETDLEDAGTAVRLQLVRNGTDVEMVLLADQDGEYVEVDRQPVPCPYPDASYDPRVSVEGGTDYAFGWQSRDNAGYGGYGSVQVEEGVLIVFDNPTPCPTEG
jgi:hypothetical protein